MRNKKNHVETRLLNRLILELTASCSKGSVKVLELQDASKVCENRLGQ